MVSLWRIVRAARWLLLALPFFVVWLLEVLSEPAPLLRTKVPDFVGLRTKQAIEAAARAPVRIEFVQLTDRPAPVEGVVVSQDRAPGRRVWRHAHVRLAVEHPSGPIRC